MNEDKLYQNPQERYLQMHANDCLYEDRRSGGRKFMICYSLLLLVIGFAVGYGVYFARIRGLL